MPERLSKIQELDIATSAANGDPQAREHLIIAHAGLVQANATEICRKYNCWDRLNDLVSEGNVALIKAVDNFDPGKGVRIATFAWLRINGAMIDYLKKNVFKGEVELDTDEKETDMPYEQLDTRLSVLSALKELNEREREVITLYYFKELSTKEVAEHLNYSVGTIKAILYRARAKLQEVL